MIEGLLRHCTDAEIDANYTDTHGASVVGFAFTELLGFKLLPRLKNIESVRLCSPDDGPAMWPRLERVVKNRPIDWALIERHYDQVVKHATALRLGTAETEQVLRRFTKAGGPKSPVYLALEELGGWPPTSALSAARFFGSGSFSSFGTLIHGWPLRVTTCTPPVAPRAIAASGRSRATRCRRSRSATKSLASKGLPSAA